MWLFSKRRPELIRDDTVLTNDAASAKHPRVLVSLDRSWYHLIGLQRLTYYRLIRRHGGTPIRVDYGDGPEQKDIVPIARDFVEHGDALLLSGGVDVDPRLYGSAEKASRIDPRRDRFELALIDAARDRGLPVLGICRGSQLINVALGGTLRTIRHNDLLGKRHRRWGLHEVRLEPDSWMAAVLGKARLPAIRSLHGQAVDQPGRGLRVSGRAEDGVAEAIESDSMEQSWIAGVQWHPELMLFVHHDAEMIREFVDRAIRGSVRETSIA